jgi:sulfopropanediol 3-dehydrogenase
MTAWRAHGAAVVVGSPEDVVPAVDGLATEHLEVQTDRNDWYVEQLPNCGSIFIGPRATWRSPTRRSGPTTPPTGQAARYSGGLSVTKFLKTLTFQGADTDAGVAANAPGRGNSHGRPDAGPRATATLRIDRCAPDRLSLQDFPHSHFEIEPDGVFAPTSARGEPGSTVDADSG